MPYLFGIALPYLAMAIFLGGSIYRVVEWGKSPVPFSIQTTCGQGKSLDFIKHDRLESPDTTAEVVARMFLEVVTFRSLFRNTKSELHDGPKITYESVNTSLIPPRPRTYGLKGAEIIEEVWSQMHSQTSEAATRAGIAGAEK